MKWPRGCGVFTSNSAVHNSCTSHVPQKWRKASSGKCSEALIGISATTSRRNLACKTPVFCCHLFLPNLPPEHVWSLPAFQGTDRKSLISQLSDEVTDEVIQSVEKQSRSRCSSWYLSCEYAHTYGNTFILSFVSWTRVCFTFLPVCEAS